MEARHSDRDRERQRDKNGCRVTKTEKQGLRARGRKKQANERARKKKEGDEGKKDERGKRGGWERDIDRKDRGQGERGKSRKILR